VRSAVRAGVLHSAHDVSDGGLATALAEAAIAGGTGAQIDLEPLMHRAGVDEETALFGEGPGGILVSGPRSQMMELSRQDELCGVRAQNDILLPAVSQTNSYEHVSDRLLQPLDRLSPGMRAHMRYPEDLFWLQRSVYAAYHVDDPRIFYFREDSWAIPTEPNADANAQKEGTNAKQMEPYYVIMRLPTMAADQPALAKRNSEEFLLMSPLAPARRESQNILGWMCARCDGEHYGELVLYRFPQQVSVNGPSQVIAYVNNDPNISPRLTPLRLAGSNANFGNLLVIPVEKSLLYIAPLYVESTSGATGLPKLQKVVVAFGDRVAMEDTLSGALSDLFPGDGSTPAPAAGSVRPPGTSPGVSSAPVPSQVRSTVLRLTSEYDAARKRLKSGDLEGYAAGMKAVEKTLDQLRQQAEGQPSRPHGK